MIKFMKLHEDAIIPKRATDGAAGFDLYALKDGEGALFCGETIEVDTGISAIIPKGWVGLVKPRSGLAFRYGVDTMAGVIDSDYRGEIKVLLTVLDTSKFCEPIKKDDRIAQLVVVPHMPDSIEIFSLDECDETDRGDNGFGSTGK